MSKIECLFIALLLFLIMFILSELRQTLKLSGFENERLQKQVDDLIKENERLRKEQMALDVTAEELKADVIRKFARWLRYKGVIGNKVIVNGEITDYATLYVSMYEEDQTNETN